MRRWIGRWVMVVGALHTLLGLVIFAPQLRELVAAGGWNALGDRDPLRNLAFWFLFGGLYGLLVGALANWIERATGGPMPRFFGWTLLGSTAVGAVLAPVSGFWLLLPPAVAALRRPPADAPTRSTTRGEATAGRAAV